MHRRLGDARRPADHRRRARRPDRGGRDAAATSLLDWAFTPALTTVGPMTEPVAERPHMPDYGVDTPDWAPLPWSWAAATAGAGRNFWVVTASADARPHAPAGVGRVGRRRPPVRLVVRTALRKAANVAANPQATIAVDDTVECLSVEGRARAASPATASRPVDRALPHQVRPRAVTRRLPRANPALRRSCPSAPSASSSGRTSSAPGRRWRFGTPSSAARLRPAERDSGASETGGWSPRVGSADGRHEHRPSAS